MQEVLYILIITSVSCSILGVFLVLRNLAMVSDAIAHSILLGIVLGYFITKNVDSIYLSIGATLFGVITTMAIELLIRSKKVSADASVGIIFPLFFSIAVILITKYARNIHLDTEVVLTGEVILAPFNRMDVLGFSFPKTLISMLFVLLINSLFIFFYFTQMKISSFDEIFAATSGISIAVLYYLFMGMVSFTAVSSFETVGAVLTIAFFVAPAASAYLITKKLKYTIFLSITYAIINSYIGYLFAIKYNISISGMCAFVSGITFLLTVFICKDGIITRYIDRINKKIRFSKELLILHIGNHRNEKNMLDELGYGTIKKHISWTNIKLKMYITNLIKDGLIYREKDRGIYNLTEAGEKIRFQIKERYGLFSEGKDMAKIDTSRNEYLIAIYENMEKDGYTTNKKLSEMLDVKAASVSEMIKKLVDSGYVFVKERNIYLTQEGFASVRKLLTKHRLWEIFLVKYLGYSWKDVHEDAKALEHVTSDFLKNKLNDFLERPMHCPHGNEIFDNHSENEKLKKLSSVKVGEKCKVHKVVDDKELLKYLEDKNISLGDIFIVKEIDEFDASMLINKNDTDTYISGKAADKIKVDIL